jgi:hypothetical protein
MTSAERSSRRERRVIPSDAAADGVGSEGVAVDTGRPRGDGQAPLSDRTGWHNWRVNEIGGATAPTAPRHGTEGMSFDAA